MIHFLSKAGHTRSGLSAQVYLCSLPVQETCTGDELTHGTVCPSVDLMALTRRDDAIAVVGLLLATSLKKKQRKPRKSWCKDWLLRRNRYTHVNLLLELSGEEGDYRNYLRMNETVYQKLLSLVSPLIQKNDTIMRTAIPPHERLTATLRFLATGRSYECLKYSTLISPQSLGRIIPETCDAIYKVLRKDYLQVCTMKHDIKITLYLL